MTLLEDALMVIASSTRWHARLSKSCVLIGPSARTGSRDVPICSCSEKNYMHHFTRYSTPWNCLFFFGHKKNIFRHLRSFQASGITKRASVGQ